MGEAPFLQSMDDDYIEVKVNVPVSLDSKSYMYLILSPSPQGIDHIFIYPYSSLSNEKEEPKNAGLSAG